MASVSTHLTSAFLLGFSFCCYHSPFFCSGSLAASAHSWPLQASENDYDGSYLLFHSTDRAKIIQHPCDSDVALYILDTIHLTWDKFQSSTPPMTVPASMIGIVNTPLNVQAISFSDTSLLLSIKHHVLIFDLLTSIFTWAETPNTHYPLKDLVAGHCCGGDSWCQEQGKLVITIFDTAAAPTTFWLSKDGGKTFVSHQLPPSYQVDHKIESGTILFSYPALAFLVRKDGTDASFVFYPYNEGQSLSRHLQSAGFELVGRVKLVKVADGRDELVIADERHLFYSPNGGQSVLEGSPHTEQFPSDDLCDQLISGRGLHDNAVIAVSVDGAIHFIKTTLMPHVKRMNLIGMLNKTDAVTVETSSVIHVWHLKENVTDSSSNFSWIRLSLSYVIDTDVEEENCQHQVLSSLQHGKVLYLDIGMEQNISTTLLAQPWTKPQLMVTVENPDLLSVQSSISQGPMVQKGVREMNMDIHVSLKASGMSKGCKEEVCGVSTLKVAVLDPNLPCQAPSSHVTYVVAGCPFYRNIKIRKHVDPDGCDHVKDTMYRLPKKNYDHFFMGGESDEDLVFRYDYHAHGCPVRVFYSSTFKPILDLYEGDTWIANMTADFTLIEARGAHSYTYKMSAKQAGCIYQPQNWLTLLSSQYQPDPYTAWTRQNYKTCYEDGDPLMDPGAEYQVMNFSSSNQIEFDNFNTVYIFSAVVLDLDYSFCQLTTQFAVEVYGAVPRGDMPAMRIMLSTCGVGIVALIVYYITHVFYLRDLELECEQHKKDSFPYQ